MKPIRVPLAKPLGLLAACGSAVLCLFAPASSAQTIPNPSFEANSFTSWPGYISGNPGGRPDNGPITGWTGNPGFRVGLNPASGSPFADNGTIPNGSNVAFIQSNSSDPATPATLSTTLSDLVVGTTYRVTFRVNARGGQTPNLKVYMDGVAVWLTSGAEGFSTASVNGAAPYWYVAFDFTAWVTSPVMSLVNDAAGDTTVLVDDFRIAPSSGRWSIEPWSYDGDSGVDSQYLYTHAYNFGSTPSPVINGVTFTGIGGNSPGVAGKFSTTYLTAGPVNDNYNLLSGSSATMGAYFVYGGNVPAGSFQSISLVGLTPGTEYVMTVFSVAWEDPAVGSRWVTFSMGDDRLTVNQDQYNNNAGIRISYRYTADTNGSATLKFAPLVPANVSFHVYGFANREAVSRYVAPVISTQPKGATLSEGLGVEISVAASGVPTPAYQWRLNGLSVPGATDNTLALPAVTQADAGNYTVVVSNQVGVVTSTVARLVVGLPLVNPSFEMDAFNIFPGYVRDNGPISGWTSLPDHGLNPAAGSPFANNGVTPHGSQVAFMQGNGALSQIVSGLTVGGDYYVHYFENSRAGYAVPAMELKVGGNTVVALHAVPAVGSGSYHEITSEPFTATAADMEIAFIKSATEAGDSTALIDNVAVVALPAGTAPSITLQPASKTVYLGQAVSFTGRAVGSNPLHYQWRLNGTPVSGATTTVLTLPAAQVGDEGNYTLVAANASGSVTSAVARLTLLETIPTLHNSGVDAAGSPLPAGSVDPNWTFSSNPDGGGAAVHVEDNAWPNNGTWLANSAASKWIGPRTAANDAGIPGGDYVYRATFDLTGRDTNSVIILGRWASDNWGTVVRVNGTVVSVPPSFNYNAWTSFAIASTNATFLPGQNTLDFQVNNETAGSTGLRLEFTLLSARTLPGVAPTIVTSPQGRTVAEGDTVVLGLAASGTIPLAYQWQKNQVDMPGKTDATLTLSSVTTNDTALYRAAVSNPWGTAYTANASVTVAYRPLNVCFGTGVGTDGNLLGDGAVDPHYALSASADPLFPGPDALAITNAWPIQPGTWLVNGPDSRWIGPSAAQRGDVDPSQGNPGGLYVYQTAFDLTGYDLSRIRLVGGWAVDNTGLDILVNGVSSGITSAGFGTMTPFALSSGLQAGPNTLDFVVTNQPSATVPNSPTGLRVDLKAYLYLLDPVVVHLSVSGANLTLSWTPVMAGQKLLSAPEAGGPWTEVPNATSPYAVTASEARRFYRVSQ